ncbi:MAG TPA: hypothetical protein VMG39_06770 [Pseudolabrys sp.]|nr:hypothetical protein [Pseudolabrys sp.]
MPRAPATAALPIVCFLLCTGPGSGLTGNDTGGIITWSPEHQAVARDWAAAHCARYNKYARITSVHAQYGDYIAFACEFDPRRPLP